MRFRFSSAAVWVGLLALGWGGLLLYGVLEKNKLRYRAVAFSESRVSAAGTNSTHSASRQNGLLRLEEELSRSFQGLDPNPSLEGVTAPAMRPRPAPVIQNKRAKELRDRQKDWIFARPEDQQAGPTIEELLNLPEYGVDGQDKKSLSPLERYYQDLTRGGAAKTKEKSLAEQDPFAPYRGTREEGGSTEDSNMPTEIRNSEQKLRKLLGTDMANFTPAPTRGSLSDIFGFGDTSSSPQEELAHKAHMKEYQQWLDTQKGPLGGGGLPDPLGAAALSRQPVNVNGGLEAYSLSGQPNRFAPQSGAADPTLGIGTLSDINAKVLNQWNPFYVPPKVEPPKVTPPPANFDIPRRKF